MSTETVYPTIGEVEAAWETLQKASRRGGLDPEKLEQLLASFVNVGFGREKAKLSDALAYEHPTLLGQIAQAVALGVMRSVEGDSWQPHDPTFGKDSARRLPMCSEFKPLADHPMHDGRLDCGTVVGAEFMARQRLI